MQLDECSACASFCLFAMHGILWKIGSFVSTSLHLLHLFGVFFLLARRLLIVQHKYFASSHFRSIVSHTITRFGFHCYRNWQSADDEFKWSAFFSGDRDCNNWKAWTDVIALQRCYPNRLYFIFFINNAIERERRNHVERTQIHVYNSDLSRGMGSCPFLFV